MLARRGRFYPARQRKPEDIIVNCRRLVETIRFAFTTLLATAMLTAQSRRAAAQSVHEHEHGSPAVASSATDVKAYLEAARAATASFPTADDATRAGFVAVFGNTPLQGAHYARPD